jgi:hypothetical protein
MINIEKFIFVYQNKIGVLNDHQRQGLTDLLIMIIGDPNIKDVRWAAYMLATVRHECAGTWLPIAEYGKGRGHKYGEPDPVSGCTYYGRGYVQLTWAANYQAMGEALGIDLYRNPDLALQPDIAYKIMSRGMRKGSFTGVGFPLYIKDDRCSYRMCRKIINGLDCADKIAGYAEEFEGILNASIAN